MKEIDMLWKKTIKCASSPLDQVVLGSNGGPSEPMLSARSRLHVAEDSGEGFLEIGERVLRLVLVAALAALKREKRP